MVEWVEVLLGDAGESIDDERSGLDVLDWRKRDHCGPLREAEGVADVFRDIEPARRLWQ